jgi:hypothetical protein
MEKYEFGAGGFKLGERVEILTTGQRGILIGETVHISRCNTYLVLLPTVLQYGRKKVTSRDHLILRKLEQCESMLAREKELTDENSFSPKGIDVNAEWIRSAVGEEKEFIPEVDDAVGVEEITVSPGMEVWNKVYGMTMIVSHVHRDIFSKELSYGLSYVEDDKEEHVYSNAYCFIPMEQKLNIPLETERKHGAVFEEGRDSIVIERGFSEHGSYRF